MAELNNDWKADRNWASERRRDVQEIIGRHLALLCNVRLATDEEDRTRATDLVVESSTGTVACRIRDMKRTFRDLTIRVRRRSGAKTEMAKLKEGYARWFFLGWATPPDARIGDYVIIDMDRVRASGLLEVRREEHTADGGRTLFVAIKVSELRYHDCLLVDKCKSDSPSPRGGHVPGPSVKSPCRT